MKLSRGIVAGVTLLVLLSCLLGQGQAREGRGGGHGYFYIGSSMVDLDKLNATLKTSQYPEFSNRLFSMGGGGHAFFNRLVLGGQGQALISKSTDVSVAGTPYKASLSAGIGFFDIGYLLTPRGNLKIYPMLGIGGGGLELAIEEKQPPSFEQILAHPNRSTRLSAGLFLVNLALGADCLVLTRQDKEGMGGLVLGIEVGYTYTPFAGGWQADEVDISGGPDASLNGPYLRLKIGGGGKRR
ncbi:MAG: hypothetical protein QHJ34_14015 [bacterium]|jgi:hypothetical protein|nr:hypothetical protein [candidate division KSB1 bacterium]MDH7561326.1 hypothetical protein [bacterium]